MVQSRTFVVFAGGFNEDIGGVVALHSLCDHLNREGCRAVLWPDARPRFDPADPVRTLWRLLKYHGRRRERQYRTFPGLDTPLATRRDLQGAIVIYPEIVDGNPLRADHVIRWLLHKPGFHTGRVKFGPGDRFFYYLKAFDDPALNPDGDNLLRVPAFSLRHFAQQNFGPREGSCYILRKGKDRPLVHDPAGSVLVDGMSNAQMAEVFNRVGTCISYDTYTLFSAFAALCGCVSVVVPQEGVTKEQWYADPRDRYGLAWGFDDVDEARRTQPLLRQQFEDQAEEARASVRRFIARCADYFPAER